MRNLEIILNENKINIKSGFIKVFDIYKKNKINFKSNRLYLCKTDEVNIPLLPDDYIIIHGDERIIIDDVNNQIEENPSAKQPVCIKFNGQKIKEGFKKAKVKSEKIRSLDKELEKAHLFADLKNTVDGFIEDKLTLVIQDGDSYFTTPFFEDGVIDLEKCSKMDRKPPKGQKFYKIKIDGEKYKVDKEKMNGTEVLELVKKTYSEWSLNQKFRGGRRVPVEQEEIVDFTQKGIERFETVRKQAQQGLSS